MKIWESEKYYEKIAKSEDFSHPGFKKAQVYSQTAKTILDVGCGDGSKLAKLGNPSTQKFGIEISKKAVEVSKKKYPKINFKHFDGKHIPFANDHFDMVTNFFVLEHTTDPQHLIQESIRVLKTGGLIIFLAPNFGSPNRAAPNNTSNRLLKFFFGIWHDFQPDFKWQKVIPKITSIEQFQPDLDTTIEPYLGSLINYLKSKKMEIVESSSFWEMELPTTSPLQKLVRVFAKNWGPHLFVIAKKL